MMITAENLALPGIRHAFFTRQGGVSDGLYSSLNGGLGSHDSAVHIAENRARMAMDLGVEPHRLLTAYQNPLAGRRRRRRAMAGGNAAARRRHRHPHARSRDRRDHGRLRPDSSRRSAGRRDRRRACRLARRACRHRRGHSRGDGAARRRTQRNSRRARPDDPAAQLRGRRRSDRALYRRRCGERRFFAPAPRDGHALFDLAGYIAASGLQRAGISQVEDLGLCTYADPARFFSFRRSTHRAEADYGRHVNAIVLTNSESVNSAAKARKSVDPPTVGHFAIRGDYVHKA